MDFEDFLPENVNDVSEALENNSENREDGEKIGHNQVYDVITSKKPDWQTIIYDLISSDQLDPWDIDIVLLTRRYFEKIAELEQADFYISSKVLLAASLLLRIKSEFLLNKHIRDIDDILFGKKEEAKYAIERIRIDEDDLPILIPKTPLPRLKRVTLAELMSALNHAINTETRRIKREVAIKRAKRLSEVDFPTIHKIDLKDRIRRFYAKILTSLKKTKKVEKHLNKVAYCDLSGSAREEKLSCFLPLLHLSNTKKLWLEQEKHLEEIYIYLYEYFDNNRDKFSEDLQGDDSSEEFNNNVEMIEDAVMKKINEAEDEFNDKIENLDEELIENEKISEEEEKEEIRKEILKEIEKEEKEDEIEKISGFSEEIE